MNSRTNLKLLLSLFAVLALNHAFITKHAAQQSADFALSEGDDGLDNEHTRSSEESLPGQFSKKVGSGESDFEITHSGKGKNKVVTKVEVKLTEGLFRISQNCDSCGISTDPIDVSLDHDIKDLKKLKSEFTEKLTDAYSKIKDAFAQKKQDLEDEKNCVAKKADQDDGDSRPIKYDDAKPADRTAKMDCFKAQLGKLKDSKKREAYQKDIVDPYMQKYVIDPLETALKTPGNAFAQMQAKSDIDKYLKLGLGSPEMIAKLQTMSKIAETNLLPSKYNQAVEYLQEQMAYQKLQVAQQAMMMQNNVNQIGLQIKQAQQQHAPAAVIKQMQAQLKNATLQANAAKAAENNANAGFMQQISQLNMRYFSIGMEARQNVTNAMNTYGGADAGLNTAAYISMGNVGQTMLKVVNADPTLHNSIGSSLGFLGNTTIAGANFGGTPTTTAFAADPFNSGVAATMASLNVGSGYTDSGASFVSPATIGSNIGYNSAIDTSWATLNTSASATANAGGTPATAKATKTRMASK